MSFLSKESNFCRRSAFPRNGQQNAIDRHLIASTGSAIDRQIASVFNSRSLEELSASFDQSFTLAFSPNSNGTLLESCL